LDGEGLGIGASPLFDSLRELLQIFPESDANSLAQPTEMAVGAEGASSLGECARNAAESEETSERDWIAGAMGLLRGLLECQAEALKAGGELSETGLGGDLNIRLQALSERLAALAQDSRTSGRKTWSDAVEALGGFARSLETGGAERQQGGALNHLIYVMNGKSGQEFLNQSAMSGPIGEPIGKPESESPFLLAPARGALAGSVIEALRALVQEAEGASRRSNPGEEAETSLNTQILFASRLSGREAPVEPRSASAVEMEGALGQTRAAIADMLERMQGEVRFDPANMRATIHLDPPALGRVQALVSIREDRQVFVTVSAENSDARDFLRQNESDLREQLERRGFSRDEISVEILDEDGNVFDRSIEGAVGAIS
jgi:hypothetical protein